MKNTSKSHPFDDFLGRFPFVAVWGITGAALPPSKVAIDGVKVGVAEKKRKEVRN